MWVTKILPAVLTAFGAIATSWIHLRKPQERWLIYTNAQRDIEYYITQYNYSDESNIQNKDKQLVDNVSDRLLKLHKEWVASVPTAEQIAEIGKKSGS